MNTVIVCLYCVRACDASEMQEIDRILDFSSRPAESVVTFAR